jgi:AcrR family transcriptional regulator
MLDAAAHVMRTRGLARATTKEIAKAAGYSEAALYKHFRDKTDLFLAVLNERTPNTLGSVLADLNRRAGQGSVRETLEDVARAALSFYALGFPMAASLYAEPDLLTAHRAALRERGAGPQHVNNALAGYLAAEQALGRIQPGVDPQAAAALLLGACFQHAFLSGFTDKQADRVSTDHVAAKLADTLIGGLVPPGHPQARPDLRTSDR